jgi:hypothetical protein
MFVKRFALVFIALFAAALLFAPTAAAHASRNTADGKYRITWGFIDEPAFAEEKHRLDLVIRDLVDPATNQTGAGVGGVLAEDLTVELHSGDAHYELGDVGPYRGVKGTTVGPGNYTTSNAVFLNRAGLYVLHVEGEINGSLVDLEIPAAHALESHEEITFPAEYAESADTSALEAQVAALTARITALEAKAATQSTTPATLTPQVTGSAPAPGLGVLAAIAAVGVAFLLIRRRA